MLRKICLYGRLAEQYTDSIELDVHDLRSTVAGLDSNFPGFKQDFIDNEWHILRGDFDKQDDMNMDQVPMMFGDGLKELHILPKIEGEGGRGLLSVVLGIAIIAVAWIAAPAVAGLGGTAFSVGGMAVSYGSIAMFGVSMALSGVAAMLAPSPSVGDSMAAERAEDRPSFMFNGAVNVMVGGGPVPLLYGEMEIGSTVISAGIVTEKL